MRRYNPYKWPPWLKNVRNVMQQFIYPLVVFQGIRTLFFPTSFDVFLLALLILLAIAFHYEWI
ncbi:hypothetical protein [Aeribacillus pallidus]|jgi:hypothetical protein|uniref:hypothetical protein n=1 Tax=Aeribacillus pallidus TaxID=33936 RepID=UPI001DC158EA|nr:hypothetical protein [Bacillus sp. (in: firmicutes)]